MVILSHERNSEGMTDGENDELTENNVLNCAR